LTKAATGTATLRADLTKTDARVTASEQAASALQTTVRDSGVEHAAAVARLSDRLASDLTVLATKTDSTLATKTDLAALTTEVSALKAKVAEAEKSDVVQRQADRDRDERAAEAASDKEVVASKADLVAAGQRVAALEAQVAVQDARLAKLEASLQTAAAASAVRERDFATTAALEATRASVDRLQVRVYVYVMFSLSPLSLPEYISPVPL